MDVAKLLRNFLAFFVLSAACGPAWAQVAWPPSPLVKLAVNPVTNKVYVLDEANDAVTVLDAATGATRTVAVGDRPAYIAVNPATNRIYVNNTGDATLTVIDGTTDTNLTPTPLALGSIGPIAVNTATNMVYIVRLTGPSTDEVSFFNGADHTWYAIATESFQPISLTVNPVTNTLYVAHYATGDVRVISAAMDGNDHPTTFSIGMWSKPFAIAANPVTNKIYVLTEDARGPIGIIDGATRTATFPAITPGHGVGPRNLAINPVTNKIYAAFNGEVIVIDGATGGLTYVPVDTGSGPAEVGVNATTNQIYVANDSGVLTVINGADNSTSTIALAAGVDSLGVNPVTNQVFVSGSAGIAQVAGSPGVPAAIPLTVSITPQPGNTTGTSAEFTLNASSGFSPNAPPVRKVYVQLDTKEGAWREASGSGSGPYTASFTGLSTGSHVLYAFATDGQDAPFSTGAQSYPLVGMIASYPFTVSAAPKANPSVSLASSLNPAATGENITFTAAVTGTAGTPTGTVEFRDGASVIAGCASVALAGGSATCTTNALGVGTHAITANYSGDTAYNAASSSALSQVVQAPLAASTTSLASSANPSSAGAPVSFTATVTGSSGTPSGTVEFRDGSTTIAGCAAVALSGGNAICTTSALSAGTHTISAHYSGNGTYSGSSSAGISQIVQASTSTNVALASAGAVATASSQYGAGYGPASVINGERAGTNWGSTGGWADGNGGVYPDWVQVVFSGTKTLDRVVVYTVQDNYANPVEPTDGTTVSLYGLLDFTVQGWNGASWVTLGTVSGNNLAKRTVTFAAFTTDRIRVNVTNGRGGYSRITEIEAWGVSAANVALASAGAVATASSQYGAGYGPASVINGERAGTNWGSTGGWADGSGGVYPDWVQVVFSGTKTLDRVVVYTVQDNYANPVEPTDGTTVSLYGLLDFTVQGWNGSSWVTLGTVSANNLAKRTVTFAAFTTDRIRVNVTNGRGGYSRITEIEAWAN